MLQHLGDGAQISALVCGELAPSRQIDDVKGIGGNNGRIHVAIVKQITNNLGTDEKERWVLKATPPRKPQMILQ